MNRKWLLALAGALAVATGLVLLYFFPPWEYHFWPKCLLHELTGIYCPGCGCTRALAALARGDIRGSLGYNVLLIPLSVVVGVTFLWPRLTWNRYFAWTVTWIILLFFVLRNLPWHPFCLLAPH